MRRPKLRKVDTDKRKRERKKAKKQLQERASMVLNAPDNCCVCKTPFDKKSKKMAQTWHVVVFEAKKAIRLTCPACWKEVEKVAEEKNGE